MPIYYGHSIPVTQKGKRPRVSPTLEKKGIELMRSAPCDVDIFGIPVAITTFWAIFTSLFSIICNSLFLKKKTGLWRTDQIIDDKHPQPLPFNLPPLCVALETQSQQAYEFLQSIGFEQTEIRGQVLFLNSQVTRETLTELLKRESPAKIDEKCFAPFKFVNLSAMYIVLDLITWFSFATQTMSFVISNDESVEGSEFENATAPEMDTDDADKSSVATLFSKDTSGSFLDQFPYGEVTTSDIRDLPAYTSPIGVQASKSGNVLRYVPELADVDKRTVLDFIQRYMLANIGSEPTEIVFVFSQIRSAWGIIAPTEFGLELSHLAMSLMIAMQTGCEAIPIFDAGYYEAVVIRGEGYHISLNKSLLGPLSPGNLVAEVGTLATHHNTLLEIEKIAFRECGELANNIVNTQSMVELRSVLLELPLTEDAKNNVVNAAVSLRFPARPWNVNLVSLERLLKLAGSLDHLIMSDPIHARALFSRDSIIVSMSCFGESSCPSFIHSNGTPIDLTKSLPRPSGESTIRGNNSKGKQQTSNAAWIATVRRIRFDEAIGDFRKMMNEKKIRSVSTSVARGTGCVVFQGKSFGTLFGLLGKLVMVSDGSASSSMPQEDTRMIGETESSQGGVLLSGRRAKKMKI